MKHKLLLLLFGILFSSATAAAQERIPLKEALRELTRLYGTKFSYAESLLDNIKVDRSTVPTNATKPVESVLKDILYPQQLLFLYVQDNYFTIIADARDVQVAESNISEPEYWRIISGQVKDTDGNPLVGVSVMPEGIGVRLGVSTNSEGNYTIRLKDKAEALVFSYMGMEPQRRAIGNATNINMQMKPLYNKIEEVEVLSTGYQKVSKERATGSFGQITSKDLKEVPALNIMERIQGLVPGMQVDLRNNEIKIRGINSFTSVLDPNSNSKRPLIVIDGFPAMDQNLAETVTQYANNSVLNQFNPEDIESITVLKDAAASSIWGAQAANGVIVIETKKGKIQPPTISLSSSLSTSAPADLNKLSRMSSADYIDLERELFNLGGIADPSIWTKSEWNPFNTNKPVSEPMQWMFKHKRGEIDDQMLETELTRLGNISNLGQIRDNVFQHAVSQQYNLSLSGGNNRSTYLISLNYSDDVPVFKKNRGQSYFLNSNYSTNFLDQRIRLNTGINYVYSKSISNQVAANTIGSGQFGYRPYELLLNKDNERIKRSILFTDETIQELTDIGLYDWQYNAIDELNYANYTSEDNRVRFNASLEAKVNSWASLSLSGMLQRSLAAGHRLDEQDSYVMREFLNIGTEVDFEQGTFKRNIPQGGKYITNDERANNYNLRLQGNIDKSFNDWLELNMIIGGEIGSQTGTSYSQTRYGFNEDTYSSASYDATAQYMTIYGWGQSLGGGGGSINRPNSRTLSYYSNAALSVMKGKYILSGSARFDDHTLVGASRSNRAKPLWSAGVKWDVKRENFLQEQKWLNALSLRATYGVGGTIPRVASHVTLISVGSRDPLTGEVTGSVSSPGNPMVGWEKVYTQNYGLDFSVLNSRLSVVLDYYKKHTTDILYGMPVNPTIGWSELTFNTAEMKGSGVDLGVSGQIIRSEDINWQSTFNFAYNTNEVTDSRLQVSDYLRALGAGPVVGKPIGYLYAYRYAGLDDKGQTLVTRADGSRVTSTNLNAETGEQITGAPFSIDDLVYMGRTQAPFFGGWMNNIRYKAFSLGVRFSYDMGHVIKKETIANYPTYRGYNGFLDTHTDLLERWRQSGDEATKKVPGIENINQNSFNRFRDSDLMVVDGSHVRLQQINFGYTFSAEQLRRLPFKTLSISATVRNLGIIWRANNDGIDPAYYRTRTYNNLPPARNYFLSVNTSF